MVGTQGFEPWSSTASGWRSPPELRAYIRALQNKGTISNSKTALCQANIAIYIFLKACLLHILSRIAVQSNAPEHIIQSRNYGERYCDPLEDYEPHVIDRSRKNTGEEEK